MGASTVSYSEPMRLFDYSEAVVARVCPMSGLCPTDLVFSGHPDLRAYSPSVDVAERAFIGSTRADRRMTFMATDAPREGRIAKPKGSVTPGRPKDAGNRQQTHPDQGSQTGSPELDEDLTRRGGTTPVPTKPASAK